MRHDPNRRPAAIQSTAKRGLYVPEFHERRRLATLGSDAKEIRYRGEVFAHYATIWKKIRAAIPGGLSSKLFRGNDGNPQFDNPLPAIHGGELSLPDSKLLTLAGMSQKDYTSRKARRADASNIKETVVVPDWRLPGIDKTALEKMWKMTYKELRGLKIGTKIKSSWWKLIHRRADKARCWNSSSARRIVVLLMNSEIKGHLDTL